jgi:hypothetical protein
MNSINYIFPAVLAAKTAYNSVFFRKLPFKYSTNPENI